MPATCPIAGDPAATRGQSRTKRLVSRRSANPQVGAGPWSRLPKLIVRVRFSSPAPPSQLGNYVIADTTLNLRATTGSEPCEPKLRPPVLWLHAIGGLLRCCSAVGEACASVSQPGAASSVRQFVIH